MRPAQMTPHWRKNSAARMPKQASTTVRRRLKSKITHSNLLYRLLVPVRVSKWLLTIAQRLVMAMTRDHQISMFTVMQTTVAKVTDEPWRVERMQTDTSELLVLQSLPVVQEQNGLADKAVAWMLAPVFFCCVVAEKAKLPQSWEATEVFSQVVVSFMLKLFVLATTLSSQVDTIRTEI